MKIPAHFLGIKIILLAAVLVAMGCGLTTLTENNTAQSTTDAQPTQVQNLPTQVQDLPTLEVELTLPPVEIPTATIEPLASADMLIPETGEGPESVTHDQVTEPYAKEKRAYSGETWKVDLLERPFTQDMTYLPYLDIVTTIHHRDAVWVYVTIKLVAGPSSAGDSPVAYGIEMDTDLDDEGDYFIWATKPEGTSWSTKGVQVLKNENSDFSGETFGKIMANEGKGEEGDLAWVRISLEDSKFLEMAFKTSLIGGNKGKFVWQAWSSGLALTSKQFDPNTHFSLDVAGSPIKDDPNYPLKAVYALDNTCRRASGYTPTGIEKGLCPIVEEITDIPGQEPAPDVPGEPPTKKPRLPPVFEFPDPVEPPY